MRAPHHEFLLVDRSQHSPSQYLSLIHSPEAVMIPDDLIRYIGDSLDWVESSNPANATGLSWYGPTVLETTGATSLAAILRAWAALFRVAPDRFELTGYWDRDSQNYERLPFERNTVVQLLERVADLAAHVDASNYLLHLGI